MWAIFRSSKFFFAFWQKLNANIFASKLNSIFFFKVQKLNLESISICFGLLLQNKTKHRNCRLFTMIPIVEFYIQLIKSVTDFKNSFFVKLNSYSQFPKIPKVHKTQLRTYLQHCQFHKNALQEVCANLHIRFVIVVMNLNICKQRTLLRPLFYEFT